MLYRWRRRGHSATRIPIDDPNLPSEQERVLRLLRARGLSRADDFARLGIFPSTLSRMLKRGLIVRPAYGLYDLPSGVHDGPALLAHAVQQVPDAVVCLISALAFHKLIAAQPASVWLAIGATQRAPTIRYPRVQFVHFGETWLRTSVERHIIENVRVQISSPAKTVVDLFRFKLKAGPRFEGQQGLRLARIALCQALRQNKATPNEIARLAQQADLWPIIEPRLAAMLQHGMAEDD